MTHRERLMAAVSHKQPDKIPIDLGSTRDSSIVVEGYEKLKSYFNEKSDNKICDKMMRVVEVDEKILKELDIDTRAVHPGSPENRVPQPSNSNKYIDVWAVERIKKENSYYYDQERFPLSGHITITDIVKYPWPDADDPGYIRGIKERILWIRKNTDCAVCLNLPAPFVHISQYLRGFEDWFADFVCDTKLLEVLFDAVLEVTMHISKRILIETDKNVDIVFCADDLGTQNGPQVSYEHYKKFIRPRHKKFFQQIHDISHAKILFHSCGSLAGIIDDLIDIGVDILNPVQVTAKGMNPLELKKKYGKNLAFWGAMDTQKVLPFGSVADVKRMVEERIEQMGYGGGYVLAPCHNLQPDVPLENILAMFQYAREYVPSFMK